MSRHTRPRRKLPVYDEDFDDDTEDNSFENQQGQERLKQLLTDLVGRWHWIALGLILGLLASFYYLSKAPKQYESTCTILVKQATSSVMKKGDEVEEIDLRSVEAINTVMERIKRSELLQRVAARSDVRAIPNIIPDQVNWLPAWTAAWLGSKEEKSARKSAAPTPQEVGGSIQSWLRVSLKRNTRLIDITVSHPSAEASTVVANAIAMEYQTELSGNRSDGRNSSLDILVKESEAARTRLQTAQNASANYQRALATLKELEKREAIRDELKRKYLPKHPKMATAYAELATYRQQFLSEFESARSSPADLEYWRSTESEWEKVTDEEGRLQTARRMLVARSSVLGSEIESQTSVFNSILTRIQESDINSQAVESEMEISSRALQPDRPSSPKRPLVLAGGSVLGVGLGCLFALILMRLDNKLHTVSQAERETSLPVLAAIADIPAKVLSQARSKSKDKTSDPASLLRERWQPRLVFREGMSSTTYAEMFRVLRASVSLLGDEKKRRITLFSSALPGEGKTLVSSNFALAAAQQGKKTLLIDLDLRKPAVHKVFGVKRDTHPHGATEVLAGLSSFRDAIYTETGEPYLHLMLSGKQAPNPGELLNTSKLQDFLREALQYYDLVILDSAPLLAVPDTRLIVPLVDNFCLVTRADYVPKGAVRRAISLLQHDNHLPAGIVFNAYSEQRRLIGQNYSYGNYQGSKYGGGYRYGYGAYGAYGSDQED